jgi:hypothetical protein
MTDPRLAARHLDPEKLRRLADDVERINFGKGLLKKSSRLRLGWRAGRSFRSA